jgi:hypothetical protein
LFVNRHDIYLWGIKLRNVAVFGFPIFHWEAWLPPASCIPSGKNSWYFHTLGYETIFLQKSNFFHTQKVLFHTLENCFIPSKKWKLFSYPYTKVSYLENFFHTLIQKFHTLSKYFSYPQKPISYPNL